MFPYYIIFMLKFLLQKLKYLVTNTQKTEKKLRLVTLTNFMAILNKIWTTSTNTQKKKKNYLCPQIPHQSLTTDVDYRRAKCPV